MRLSSSFPVRGRTPPGKRRFELRKRRALRCAVVALALGALGPELARAQLTAVLDSAAQQPGAIDGVVLHALTGEPVIGARIRVMDTNATALTDNDGVFRVGGVPAGTRRLTIEAEGMRALGLSDLPVNPGRTLRLRAVELRPLPENGAEPLAPVFVKSGYWVVGAGEGDFTPVALAAVLVSPSRYAVAEEALASTSTMRREDLEALPHLAEDVYRAVSRLPGLSTSDASSRFWVRGAPNDQVLARFDGVDLVEPFHVKDFDAALSIVDLSTVGQVNLITGGFPAEYGGRSAGVLTMESEAYDPFRPRNSLGASLTDATATTRGEAMGGRVTWLLNARAGYPDLMLSDQWARNGDLRARYEDVSGKLEFRLTPDHGVSIHFLHAADRLSFVGPGEPAMKSSYGSDYVWARWRGAFGERLYGETVLSYAHLDWRHRGAGSLGYYLTNLRDDRDLDLISLRQDWTLVASDQAMVRAGFNYMSGESEYRYDLRRDLTGGTVQGIPSSIEIPEHLLVRVRKEVARPHGDSVGMYVAPRFRVGPRLTLEPSARYDYHVYLGEQTVSPRFNASYTAGRATIRAAWGLFYQSQGLHQLGVADGDLRFHPSERAEHRVLSVERPISPGVTARIEVYERRMTRLRSHWESLVNAQEIFPELRFDRVQLTPSAGVARGVELMLESRRRGPWNWAASYTLSSAQETVDGREIPLVRDQRHAVALDVSYTPRPGWQIAAAWQFHSGWPTTEVTYATEPGRSGGYAIVARVGQPYAVRLPSYHRLDLRVTREFTFRHGSLRVFVDVFNAYDQDNLQGYLYTPVGAVPNVRTERRPIRQLSILPNVGAVWSF